MIFWFEFSSSNDSISGKPGKPVPECQTIPGFADGGVGSSCSQMQSRVRVRNILSLFHSKSNLHTHTHPLA